MHRPSFFVKILPKQISRMWIILFMLKFIFQSSLWAVAVKPVEIFVDASQEIGDLPTVWIPGISTNGLGASITPMGKSSEGTLNMWNDNIGFDRGVHEVLLDHWVYEAQDGVEANLEQYAQYIQDIVEYGGTPLVRLIGTPEYLRTSEEWNYYAYPPSDLAEWKDFIYDELKYIIVEYNGPEDLVNNFHLFQDYANHRPLGLGDDILFSCWYSIWGIDPFQWRGSEQEFLDLWKTTYEASKKLEEDYPEIDVKLGGFGLSGGNENLVVYQDIGMWDDDSADGYSGFVYDLINYSHDPNGDGDSSDRIPIDWVDYQFRHPDPFAISSPAGWLRDCRGQLKTYLALFGYDPTTLIMANAWHGQFRVMGLEDSFGNLIEGGVETQSEIDAALNPARLFDMELAGQQQQYREALQDFAVLEDPWNPLFRTGWEGGIGIVTLGLESEDWLGLKKATFNSFKLIDMLGDIKLYSTSDGDSFLNNQYTVNVYATKNSQDNSIQVLIWTYVSPFRFVDDSPPDDQVAYDELYGLIVAEMGSDYFYINLLINNLDVLSSQNIRLTRYLIDKYHSNAFEYRNQICNALGLGGCLDEDIYTYDTIYHMEQINTWISDNSPYNVSVDLEVVEDSIMENQASYSTTLALLPYSVTLLTFSPSPPDTTPPDSTFQPGIFPTIFNSNISINYQLLNDAHIGIKVYNILGQKVVTLRDETLNEGNYSITWNGTDSRGKEIPQGVYFVKIQTAEFEAIEKILRVH